MRGWLVVALSCLAACGFTFERSSSVIDRRVLALVAEPAEIVAGPTLPSSVRVTALVAQPGASAVPLAHKWRVCLPGELDNDDISLPFPVADAVTGRCPKDVVLFEGTAASDALFVDVPVPAELGLLLALSTQANVPVSLHVTVELEVETPEGAAFAMKRLVLSPALPTGRVPNANPRVLGVLFDSVPWEEGDVLEVPFDACGGERVEAVFDATSVRVCEHRLDPLFDPREQETYRVQALKRAPDEPTRVLELKEQLSFSWFVDRGQISRQTTRTPEQLELEQSDPLSTRWRESPVFADEVTTLWLVVRDGRGGTAFLSRQLRFVR